VRHGTAVWISNDGRGHGVPVTRAGDWHGSSVLVHHAPLHSAAARPPRRDEFTAERRPFISAAAPRRADIDYCRRVSTFHRRRTPIHSRTDRVITQAGCMAAAGVGRAPGCVCLSCLFVHALKGKRLVLSTPKSAQLQSMAGTRRALTLRSVGQGQGYDG